VRFILARDPAARFRFASLQSDARGASWDGRATETIVLLDAGKTYVKSTAACGSLADYDFRGLTLRPSWLFHGPCAT